MSTGRSVVGRGLVGRGLFGLRVVLVGRDCMDAAVEAVEAAVGGTNMGGLAVVAAEIGVVPDEEDPPLEPPPPPKSCSNQSSPSPPA